LLDALPPDDPGAMASRRDLERINLLMGNADILARLLQSSSDPQPPRLRPPPASATRSTRC